MFETDAFKTKNGLPVKITFIKHGSLMIDFNGKFIYIDPASMYADFSKMPKADFIFITHKHMDHFDKKAITALKTAQTQIVLNPASQQALGEGVAMKNGDTLSLAKDFTVAAVPAYNIPWYKQLFHPHNGRDNGYLLTLDGLCLYIAGDTENIPELADLKGIDIAFLPMNMPTMTPEQGVSAAKTIKPKVLYPYHFGNTKFPDSFAKELKTAGIEVRFREMQ